MLKKLCRILICMLVAMNGIGFAAYAASDDITGHWSEPYFRSLSARGVINPNGKGHFTPTTPISRAEFMRYINRAFGFTEQADVSQYKDISPDQWYYEAVRTAVRYGYISGLSATQMAPEKEITREQAITILGRLCKIDAGTVKPNQLKFSDRAKVSTWSAPYIKWGVDNGYIAGYTNHTFQPKRSVTRGEAAKILYYFTGTILNQSGTTYNSTSLNKDTKNVTVSTPCSLSGLTISGNLYLSEGLKQQDTVTLNNVTVQGRLVAAGGNIQFNHVKAQEVYIHSPFSGREVKVTSSGTTSVAKVTAVTTAQLIQTGLQAGADGFKKIEVTGNKNEPVTLNGRFADVVLAGKDRLIVSPGTYIQSLQVKGAATIEGSGTIQNAVFAVPGAASTIEPVTYSFHKGASATLNGVLTSTNRTQPNHTLTPASVQMNSPNEVVFAITSDDRSAVRSVMLGDRMLQSGVQYLYDSVTGSIRLFASAFQGLPNGTHTVQVIMSTGVNPTAVITFSGSTGSQEPNINPNTNQNTNQNTGTSPNLTAQFSSTSGNPANQDIVLTLGIDNSVVVQAVLLEGKQMTMPAQYTIAENRVILNKDAFAALTAGKKGSVSLAMMLSNGQTISAKITLI